MVSNFQGIRQQGSSPHIPQSANHNYYIEQVPLAGYMGPELGRTEHQHLRGDYHQQNPHPFSFSLPQFYNTREAIQREIEKEQIRAEIIMTEITRRRVLEAEVRREMMMGRELIERELALRRCSNVFSFSAPSVMESDSSMRLPLVETRLDGRSLEGRIAPSLADRERLKLPLVETRLDGRSLEGRIAPSLADRERLNGWCENGQSEPLPFQRGSASLRISEVKPVPERGKQKEKIILLAKPSENISGSKRKVETSPCGVDASEVSLEGNSRKKAKEEWSCALCQVSATNELGLNEHLNGKKHKAALGAKKAGKNYTIGLISKKSVKSIQGPGTVNPSTDNEVKVTSESLLSSKTGEASSNTDDLPLLQENLNSDKLSKKELAEVQKMQKNDDDPKKKKFRFWCEICQLGAFSEKVINDHRKGKKHARMLQQSSQNGEAGTSSKKDRSVIVANDAVKLDEHKAVDENKAVGVAVDVTNPGIHQAGKLMSPKKMSQLFFEFS